MRVKLFEVRDRMTFLPVFAISSEPSNEGQGYLLRRVGFNPTGGEVIVGFLNGERESTADPYFWGDRTLQTAHLFIRDNFEKMNDGDVVDVEFILGESTAPKISERAEIYAHD